LVLAQARCDLGETAFAVAWHAGRALSLADAVAAALTVPGQAVAAASAGKPLTAAARHGLTPREAEVLQLVREGCSNRQIGERLFISERTARTHVQNILDKLDVATRAAAAAYAVEHGLIGSRNDSRTADLARVAGTST
jgi:DNA-binding NarL/FixJ family response regulator